MPDTSDIKAGGAFVEVGTKLGALDKGLKAAEEKLKAFGQRLTSYGKRIAVTGTAMMAGLGVAVQQFASYGDQVAKMARRTGLSVTALSELGHVAELLGSNLDDIEKATKRMSRAMTDASRGLMTYQRAFDDLGLTTEDLMKMSPEKQFLAIGEAISKLTTFTAKSTAAQEIFGRAGTKLIPVFELGAEGIEHYRKEAQRLGIVIGPKLATLAERLVDMWTRQKMALRGVGITIASEVGPWFEKMLVYSTNLVINFREWLSQNPQIINGFRKIAITMIAVGTALIFIGTSMKVASLLLSPGGILVGIIAFLLHQSGALDDVIGKWKDYVSNIEVGGKKISEWFDLLRDVWVDIKPVWKAGVEALWTTFQWLIKNISIGLNSVLVDFIVSFDKFFLALSLKLQESASPIAKGMAEIVRGLRGVSQDVALGIVVNRPEEAAALKDIENRMQKAWDKIKKNAKTAGKSIGEVVSEAIADVVGKESGVGPGMKFGDIFKGLGKDFEEWMDKLQQIGGSMGLPSGAPGPQRNIIGTFSGAAAAGLAGTGVLSMQLAEQKKATDLLEGIERNTGQPAVATLG